jgi:hypothetical protein
MNTTQISSLCDAIEWINSVTNNNESNESHITEMTDAIDKAIQELSTPMNYEFYLFVQLRNAILPTTSEYDFQYEIDCTMYEEFLASSFNNGDEPLYDCILKYLSNKR